MSSPTPQGLLRAAEVAAWTLLLVGVWVATLTVVDGPEIVAALVCAVPCAVLATATRSLLGTALRPRASWWRWLALLPLAVVVDTAQLAVAVVRSVARGTPLGTGRTLLLPAADGDGGIDRVRTHAALGSLVLSISPGAYVSDVGDRAGGAGHAAGPPRVLHLHALASRPSALERAVGR